MQQVGCVPQFYLLIVATQIKGGGRQQSQQSTVFHGGASLDLLHHEQARSVASLLTPPGQHTPTCLLVIFLLILTQIHPPSLSYHLFSSLLKCQQRVKAPASLLPLVAPTPHPCPLHCWPGLVWPWSLPCIQDMLVSSWWARGRCGWSRKCAGMAIYVNACRACTHWGGLSTSSDWSSGHSHCPHFFIFPIILCWGRASIAQSLTQPA